MKFGKYVIGSSLLLSLALLAGRATGFLRELVLTTKMGLTYDADIAIMLLTLPDLLVNLLLSGGLSAALIPEFRKLDCQKAASLYIKSSFYVFLFFSVLGLIFVVFPKSVFALIAPGLPVLSTSGRTALFVCVALALPLTALSGVTSSYLNANDRFFVAGLGTLIFNLAVIIGLCTTAFHGDALLGLATGIALGSAIRWLSQLSVLPGETWKADNINHPLTRDIVVRFVSALSATSLIMLVPVILRAMASLVGEGGVAAFNLATKLVELPIGIAITTISTVAFPVLCEAYHRMDRAGAKAVYFKDMGRSLILALAISIPSMWFCDDLVGLALHHGAMGINQVALVADITRVTLLSLPFVAISSMAMAALNAANKTNLLLRTVVYCLISLPLLAWPGIYFKNLQLLAASMVVFQALLAFWLSWHTGFSIMGREGWLGKAFLRSIFTAALVVLAFIIGDYLLAVKHGITRSLLGCICVAACCWSGLRHYRHEIPVTESSAI